MIQVYSPGNTNYTRNGDMVLMPISCMASFVLKGDWKLTLEHPIDDDTKWTYIVEGAVLSVPTFLGKNQLYRIYKTTKSDTSVTADAMPIFFDSAHDVMLNDSRPTNKTGQEALNWIMAGTSYSGVSDISTAHSANYVRKNLIEAINGSDDDSFINRWGGEPIYRNYTITVNEHAGVDRGVQIVYGKNLTSIKEEIDMSEVVTRIYPIAYNGYTLADSQPYVDSPLISNYPIVYTREIKYDNLKLAEDANEDDDPANVFDTLAELRAALTAAANAEFTNGIDKPKVTITVDMVDLSKTEEYKDYAILESVALGDNVHCRHSKLNITSDARVVELTWDCVRDCISTVKIGAIAISYFNKINNTITKVGNTINSSGDVMAAKVSGLLDLQKTKLRLQKDSAEAQDVRAILFEDLDQTSPTYGALCIGTLGIEISSNRNPENTDWVWGTAIDSQTIYADNMIAGILTDKEGKNFWNLDTGEFWLSGDSTINGSSARSIINDFKNLVIITNVNIVGVPTDADGTYSTFPEQDVTFTVWYLQNDVSSQCDINVTASSGLQYRQSGDTRTVYGLTKDRGTFTITATYTDSSGATYSDVAYVVFEKVKTGRENAMPGLDSDVGAALRLRNSAFYPSSITFTTTEAVYYHVMYTYRTDERTWYGRYRYTQARTSATIDIATMLDGLEDKDKIVAIACFVYDDAEHTHRLGARYIQFLTDLSIYTDPEIFDILTGGGAAEGLYLNSGDLYGNFTYVKFDGAEGTIGGWTIELADLLGEYIDPSDNNIQYKTYLRPPAGATTRIWETTETSDGSTWASTSYLTAAGDLYLRKTTRPFTLYNWFYLGVSSGTYPSAAVRALAEGQLQFATWTGSSAAATHSLILESTPTNGYALRPYTSSGLSLGTSSYLWSDVYAANGTIQTSDEKDKMDIVPIDDRIKNFILTLDPVSYKMKAGTSGRTHYGFTAQSVKEKMDALGISSSEFAGYIEFDKKHNVTCTVKVIDPETGEERDEEVEMSEPLLDEHGNPVKGYGLRYEEFVSPLIAVVQEQQARIEHLEEMLKMILDELK